MGVDPPQAQNGVGCIASFTSGDYVQCSSCFQWHYGNHFCGGSTVFWPVPTLTVTAVEQIVARALEEHDKKYLAIIEKLADALAGKK